MGQNHSTTDKLIIIGSIGAPFGIHGWVKVNSYTEPKDNFLKYDNWLLIDSNCDLNQQYQQQGVNFSTVKVLEIKESNDKFLVLFASISDRNAASLLTNKKIAVTTNSLPQLEINQYYWNELIGCHVYNLSKQLIGKVNYLFSTAANDVMVVKNDINNKEYFIPYSFGSVVISVDIFEQVITVDWDSD